MPYPGCAGAEAAAGSGSAAFAAAFAPYGTLHSMSMIRGIRSLLAELVGPRLDV
jgi:hypothetical protein